MKICRDIFLVAFFAVSSMAFAECPKSSSLGQIDAALDFCAQINPQFAPQYMELKSHIVQGATVKEISGAYGSADFRQAYDAMRDAFEKVPRAQAIQACTSTIQTKK